MHLFAIFKNNIIVDALYFSIWIIRDLNEL